MLFIKKEITRCLANVLHLILTMHFILLSEGLINSFREQEDYEGFKLAAIVNFGLQSPSPKKNLKKPIRMTLLKNYTRKQQMDISAKLQDLQKHAVPVFKNIRVQQGSHIENVVVPFTDGRKGIQVLANLQKTLDTDGRELTNALERQITLAIIDDTWKEHLRAMDDLKQSVQTAYLEQKDPLVIYKIEAFELFRRMDSEVNRDIVSFLCHSNIPVEQNNGNYCAKAASRKPI